MPSTFDPLYKNHAEPILNDLFELLRIPSISPDETRQGDCHACAQFLRDYLANELHFTPSHLIESAGNPLVFASLIHNPSLPTVLFYGHYDVQKVGDLAEWTETDPFDPKVVSDRLYARGAQDNKGQFMYVLGAVKALHQEGALGYNVKVLLEGEEEVGSDNLHRLLPQLSDQLKADILLVCDTSAPALGQIGITLSLRGIAELVFKLHGPKTALHSGMYGGAGPNPIPAAARLVQSFHNEDQSIAVAGFMDKVRNISPELAADVVAGGPTDAELLNASGWSALTGEPGFSPQVRSTLRPTVEFTSIKGGELGSNSIPTDVTVRICARLVPDQDPAEAVQQLREHLRKNAPPALELSQVRAQSGAWFYQDKDSQHIAEGRAAVERATGTAAKLLYEGGSIPIIPELEAHSGAKALLYGGGLSEDNPHGPNESFHLRQFELGFLTACELLGRK